jgi:hypothetical protein
MQFYLHKCCENVAKMLRNMHFKKNQNFSKKKFKKNYRNTFFYQKNKIRALCSNVIFLLFFSDSQIENLILDIFKNVHFRKMDLRIEKICYTQNFLTISLFFCYLIWSQIKN